MAACSTPGPVAGHPGHLRPPRHHHRVPELEDPGAAPQPHQQPPGEGEAEAGGGTKGPGAEYCQTEARSPAFASLPRHGPPPPRTVPPTMLRSL